MTNFESSSFDFNMKMKILIVLKIPFLILPTIFDLMLVLVSVNYFGNLNWQYKLVIYYVPKNRFLLKHNKSFYSIKLQRFLSLIFSSFVQFTVPFTLRVLNNFTSKSFKKFANFNLKIWKCFASLYLLI